jgi:hypothetical protein
MPSSFTQLLRATLMLSCMASLTASTFDATEASLSTSRKLLYLRLILPNMLEHVLSKALSFAVVALRVSTFAQNWTRVVVTRTELKQKVFNGY